MGHSSSKKERRRERRSDKVQISNEIELMLAKIDWDVLNERLSTPGVLDEKLFSKDLKKCLYKIKKKIRRKLKKCNISPNTHRHLFSTIGDNFDEEMINNQLRVAARRQRRSNRRAAAATRRQTRRNDTTRYPYPYAEFFDEARQTIQSM
jgi:hypothetical protein